MIVVTGATGQLGSRVVAQLLDRLPAAEIAVSVRDPARAAALAERGVTVRQGDFAEPGTLADAFAGAEQVLVVSVDAFGEVARERHTAAIRAAVQAGAERVLYTSHAGASSDSSFAAMPDHAATEHVLAAAGAPWTSLRNGFYAATVPFLMGRAVETGQLVAPADGPVAWTAHDDLAEAAAVVLAEPGRLDGVTPPLTASEALDLGDVAAIASELTGRRIERIPVDDGEWTAGLRAQGVPEGQAAGMLGILRAARRGEFAAVDPTLEQLLGRRPRMVREVLAAHLAR